MSRDADYKLYVLDQYLLTYPNHFTTKVFSCDQYYGIVFFFEGGQTQVLHNKDLGNRLITNMNDGSWHDIPFKADTFWFLPDGITVLEIG